MVSSIQWQVSSDPRALAMILPVIMVLAAAQTGEAQGDNDTLTVEAQQARVNEKAVTCTHEEQFVFESVDYPRNIKMKIALVIQTENGEDEKVITTRKEFDDYGCKKTDETWTCDCGRYGCAIKCGPDILVNGDDFNMIFHEDYTEECTGCKGGSISFGPGRSEGQWTLLLLLLLL